MHGFRHIIRPVGLLVASAMLPATAIAMPQYARKYGVECAMCHTAIPRLNEYGFNFRKAGFRAPEEIGKDTKTAFGDTFAARIQARYDYKRRDDQSAVTTTNQVTLHEVTLYPISAAFGKYYSSLMEISILGEDFVEIENAYFRFTAGKEKAWLSVRAGIFHPFEGYGASDRPYTLTRPLFQRAAANHNGSTFFTPWNFDEAGVEAAYVHGRSSLSATLFNGLYVKGDEGALKAFPAAGGRLQKAGGFVNKNSKDVQLFLNQILKDDGSGVSVYFYRGTIDLPIPGIAADAFGPSTSFGNDFYRAALYGDWRVMPKLELQAAYQLGQDHLYDPAVRSAAGTFKSKGWLGEADVPATPHLTLGARYEQFDPSQDKAQNTRNGVTVFANVPFNDGLQVISEYQHVAQQRVGKDDLKDDNFQVRLIWIW